MDGCRNCGRPLPERAGKRGRQAEFCSPACRQRAYRTRQNPTSDDAVTQLIGDIEQRVKALAPQLPAQFYTDVSGLSTSVGRLRRIARLAVDTAKENVTPEPVTQSSALAGADEWEFAALVEPYRRELQVHCYRMVGSFDDAEDLVQETFLRAWRGREGHRGEASERTWLYRIATNASLDFLRRNTRSPGRYEPVPGLDSGTDEPLPRLTWLQPFPDELLDEVVSDEAGPEGEAVSKETIELVFLVAIQHLPPRQRAVLILRDVLGWPAADTAKLLDMSVASANSALQRARPTLREHLPRQRSEWVAGEPSRSEREILDRYMAAAVEMDLDSMVEMLSEDVRLTMPPNPFWFVGREAIRAFLLPTFTAGPESPEFFGRWRSVRTSANRQPAVAHYVQRPGTTVYRAQVLDVVRIEGGQITEIMSFEPHLFAAFGLPLTMDR